MPDVSGKRLDVAKSDIKRAGFGSDVEVLGGGMFGVIEEANWTVCKQLPEAGAAMKEEPRLTDSHLSLSQRRTEHRTVNRASLNAYRNRHHIREAHAV